MEDSEGDYNIYINRDLSPEAKAKTIQHEQTHIKMGDTHSELPISDIEERCHYVMQEMPEGHTG